MYFIGIDISKYKHDCFIMNETKQVIRDSFSFENNKDGFNLFLDVVKSLDRSQEIKVGLEATGHYGDNLKLFLNDHNLSFMEINPLKVKNYIRSISSKKEKNDKIDARYIAKYIASSDHEFRSYHIQSYHLTALKSLTRYRESLIKTRSSYLVQITNALDKVFPEFKDFWGDNLPSTALFILKKYKTALRISKFTRNDIINCHNFSRNIPLVRFEELKLLAKNTIGHNEDYLTFELISSINMYEYTDELISNVESQIDSIISQYDSPIFHIKGIGKYSAAAILSEYGNLERFDTCNQMVAFAGLDCSRNQSGTEDHKGKTVKHGSTHLRYNLLNIIRPLCLHNSIFKAYYSKKRVTENKPRRVAEIHTAKKLIRILFTIYNSYDENGELMKFNESKLK